MYCIHDNFQSSCPLCNQRSNQYCIHNNFQSSCPLCNQSRSNQYCRLCSNPNANHNEFNCSYRTQAAISSAMRQRSCRALGCITCLPGQTHYCNVCHDNDATHRSINCPLRSSINIQNNIQNNQTIFMQAPQPSVFVQAQPQIAYVQRRHQKVIVIDNRTPQPIINIIRYS